MAARSLAGPTSRRTYRRADLEESSINNVQYEGVVNGVIVVVAMFGVGR
jgi:hypothetical protein